MGRNLDTVRSVSYLSSQLPNAVNKLDKNGWAVSICVVLITMSNTLSEMSDMRAISGEATFNVSSKVLEMNIHLPAGSGDRSSATLSRVAPRNHEWCGNNCPAWAWPRKWVGSFGPSRHCSAPLPRFSQTPPCLRSATLLPGSAKKNEKG